MYTYIYYICIYIYIYIYTCMCTYIIIYIHTQVYLVYISIASYISSVSPLYVYVCGKILYMCRRVLYISSVPPLYMYMCSVPYVCRRVAICVQESFICVEESLYMYKCISCISPSPPIYPQYIIYMSTSVGSLILQTNPL